MTTAASPAALGAWLQAIAQDGWAAATLDSAAARAGLPAASLLDDLGDKWDALSALLDATGRAAARGAATGGTVRDRLFDGIMQGFDRLQADRAAVLAIAAARDPGVALLVAGRTTTAVRRLAAAAGLSVSGARDAVRLAALGGLLARAFAAWRTDDSPDMAATMAELDSLLARAERAELEGLSLDLLGLPGLSSIAGRLGLPFGRGDRVPPPSPDPPGE